MNIKPPLAATLLMTASVAMAQLAQPNPSNPALGGSLGAMTDPNPFPSDIIPPPMDWASPACTHIPCAIKDNKADKSAGNQADLEKRMAEQRKLTPNDPLLDLGDGKSFGIIFTDASGKKTISVDDGMSNGMPRPLTAAENAKLAAQTDKAKTDKAAQDQLANSINGDGSKSINNGKGSINAGFTAMGVNPNTNTGSPAPITLASTNGSDGSSGMGGSSPQADSPTDIGKQFSSDLGLGGGLPASGGGLLASAGSPGSSAPSGSTGKGYIPVSPNDVKAQAAQGMTFIGNIKAEGNIPRIAESVNAALGDGAKTGRISVDSTYGTGEEVGKTQASQNGSGK